jgi:hypothetical protein
MNDKKVKKSERKKRVGKRKEKVIYVEKRRKGGVGDIYERKGKRK